MNECNARAFLTGAQSKHITWILIDHYDRSTIMIRLTQARGISLGFLGSLLMFTSRRWLYRSSVAHLVKRKPKEVVPVRRPPIYGEAACLPSTECTVQCSLQPQLTTQSPLQRV